MLCKVQLLDHTAVSILSSNRRRKFPDIPAAVVEFYLLLVQEKNSMKYSHLWTKLILEIRVIGYTQPGVDWGSVGLKPNSPSLGGPNARYPCQNRGFF